MKELFKKKQNVVSDIIKKFNNSTCVLIINYRGLVVSKATELRKNFKQNNIEYKVLKNNLIKLACNELKIYGFDNFLKGPTAVIFGNDDIIPSKIIFKFIKKHNLLEVKGGLLNGEILTMIDFKKISELPSKKILLSQISNAFSSPIKKILFLFIILIKNLISVIIFIKEQKEKQEKIV